METLISPRVLGNNTSARENRSNIQNPRSTCHIQTMEAAVITAPGEVHFQNVSIPQPQAGEVRVRLEGCGVCGSNLAPWEGRSWFKYPFAPGEPGHEGWGYVDGLGAGVKDLRIGDRVA